MVKRLEPNERRDQIVQAAVDLAKEVGYHNITRDEVADRAKVSYGLVSRYFLVSELKARVMLVAVKDSILEIVAAGLATGDPVARSAPRALRKKAANLISS